MTTIRHYYNEFDKDAANWLRDLIAAKLIPEGDVDERSIVDVRADDLRGYTQCHFFAGVAGWPLALQLAGVPPSRRLWSGSCPCQPFSQAGKQKGVEDERHLWPVWFWLIRESREKGFGPPLIFGEQVASAINHGWLDLVCGDLEGEGYACGSSVLGAHSAGAFHIRQRCFFLARELAYADLGRSCEGRGYVAEVRGLPEEKRQPKYGAFVSWGSRTDVELGNNNNNTGLEGWGLRGSECPGELLAGPTSDAGELDDPEHSIRRTECPENRHTNWRDGSRRASDALLVADSRGQRSDEQQICLLVGESRNPSVETSGGGGTVWSNPEWVYCRDGKYRPTQSGLFPLSHGLPRSVGTMQEDLRGLAEVAGLSQQSLAAAKSHRKSCLRAYGNAIVPQTAALFIRAFLETEK